MTFEPRFYFLVSAKEIARASTDAQVTGEGIANAKLVLSSGRKTWKAVTNDRGMFAFYGVPQGEYQLQAPSGKKTAIELPAHACTEYDLRN